jgi:two-component system, chemotaxis family, protein-glutamate methylesterase/glutaminase
VRGGSPACVVGIGASAGGVDALIRLVRPLPSDLRAAICVVVHLPSSGRSLLAPILDRQTELEVVEVGDDGPMESGRVYVAPNDRHLVIADGRVLLDRGPKENGLRPAVDPMLRTLAAAYGTRAIAVILSGALGDGAAGAVAVQHAGGAVIVQAPDDATVPSMPERALHAVGEAAMVLGSRDIARLLEQLVDDGSVRDGATMPPAAESSGHRPIRPDGPPSAFTCPECNGPLWEREDGRVVRYTCRVGHSYSDDAMVVAQGSAVEAALWAALEAVEERAEFLRRMADRHGEGNPRLRDRFHGAAGDALHRAELIRRALGAGGDGPHALDPHAEVAG